MDRQRIGKPACAADYTSQLHEAIGKFLPSRGLGLVSNDRRVRWTDRLLAIMAILVSWQNATTIADAFESARGVLVRMYVSRKRPGKTLAGYLDALQLASGELLEVVTGHLRLCVQRMSGRLWWWRRWVVMAVDGSRIDCPRTSANEAAFGCAGKDKTTPQQYVTTIFHATTGLIWDYCRGAGTASEREHLLRMVPQLPGRALLLMDAGYTGYDLLGELMRSGHDFIVRVGRNVKLLKRLGYAIEEHDGIVYLWPERCQRKEPLVLRLVRLGKGRKKLALLTSVLDKRVLSDAQIGRWYCMRWVVETSYRSLKQTLGKRKMLSDAPHKAQAELDWAMVGLWMLGLMACENQRRLPQGRWSAAQSLRAVRRSMRDWRCRPPSGGLRRQLRAARIDGYVRKGPKITRAWPHKKNEKPCGTPQIRMATKTEIRAVQKLRAIKMPA